MVPINAAVPIARTGSGNVTDGMPEMIDSSVYTGWPRCPAKRARNLLKLRTQIGLGASGNRALC